MPKHLLDEKQGGGLYQGVQTAGQADGCNPLTARRWFALPAPGKASTPSGSRSPTQMSPAQDLCRLGIAAACCDTTPFSSGRTSSVGAGCVRPRSGDKKPPSLDAKGVYLSMPLWHCCKDAARLSACLPLARALARWLAWGSPCAESPPCTVKAPIRDLPPTAAGGVIHGAAAWHHSVAAAGAFGVGCGPSTVAQRSLSPRC